MLEDAERPALAVDPGEDLGVALVRADHDDLPDTAGGQGEPQWPVVLLGAVLMVGTSAGDDGQDGLVIDGPAFPLPSATARST